jgi:hypothetical protein
VTRSPAVLLVHRHQSGRSASCLDELPATYFKKTITPIAPNPKRPHTQNSPPWRFIRPNRGFHPGISNSMFVSFRQACLKDFVGMATVVAFTIREHNHGWTKA